MGAAVVSRVKRIDARLHKRTHCEAWCLTFKGAIEYQTKPNRTHERWRFENRDGGKAEQSHAGGKGMPRRSRSGSEGSLVGATTDAMSVTSPSSRNLPTALPAH